MIHIVQPPSERNVITGGYRYNAEIARRLEASRLGQIVPTEPDRLLSTLRDLAQLGPDQALVIDSLYMALFKTAPDWLDELASLGGTRLLLHYLPSLNPRLDDQQRIQLQAAEQEWIRSVESVITPSELMADRIREQNPAVFVAAPGVDACFRSVPGVIRRWVRGETLTVLAVGSLIPEKGQLEVARALANLPDHAPPIRFVLLGDNQTDRDYTAAIVQEASRHRTPLSLVMTGCLEPHEVAVHLQRGHLYVSASIYESFGMATSEAVATGIPVLSYRTGEVDHWISEGAGGRLVEPGDQRALSAALTELVTSPEALHALGDHAGSRSFSTWEDSFLRFVAGCRREGGHGEGTTGVSLYSHCDLPTGFGTFQVSVYRADEDDCESILIQMGDLGGDEPPFVRVHSECYTGEVLGSLKCDCQAQLNKAMSRIAEQGRGAIIYLRQEGRGIGLGNKIRAYQEQAAGADTVRANHLVGFPTDLRDFTVAAQILRLNGIRQVLLNTNNPDKIASLEANGITVQGVIPSATKPNEYNLDYLQTKFDSLGHAGLKESLRRKEQ